MFLISECKYWLFCEKKENNLEKKCWGERFSIWCLFAFLSFQCWWSSIPKETFWSPMMLNKNSLIWWSLGEKMLTRSAKISTRTPGINTTSFLSFRRSTWCGVQCLRLLPQAGTWTWSRWVGSFRMWVENVWCFVGFLNPCSSELQEDIKDLLNNSTRMDFVARQLYPGVRDGDKMAKCRK